jgi:hypothetical protein
MPDAMVTLLHGRTTAEVTGWAAVTSAFAFRIGPLGISSTRGRPRRRPDAVGELGVPGDRRLRGRLVPMCGCPLGMSGAPFLLR